MFEPPMLYPQAITQILFNQHYYQKIKHHQIIVILKAKVALVQHLIVQIKYNRHILILMHLKELLHRQHLININHLSHLNSNLKHHHIIIIKQNID
jgi:hypothetical protein